MTTLYQLAPQSHIQMMGYVLHTEEGRLAVIDGGKAADAPYLLALLHRLAGGVPEVDAWFLTHAHSDHVDALLALSPVMGSLLRVKTVCHAFPPASFIGANEPDSRHTIDAYDAWAHQTAIPQTILRRGDEVAVGSARFDVLRIWDPTLTMNALNNSSTVLRLQAEGLSTLFLGDLGVEGGRQLLRESEDALRCDLVQMAHHGQSGVERAVYEAIRPSMCLWPTPRWLWENNQGGRGPDSGPWTTRQVAADMQSLRVTEHAIAMDGTYRITLSGGQAKAVLVDAYAAQ